MEFVFHRFKWIGFTLAGKTLGFFFFRASEGGIFKLKIVEVQWKFDSYKRKVCIALIHWYTLKERHGLKSLSSEKSFLSFLVLIYKYRKFQVNFVHIFRTIYSQSLPWLILFYRNLNALLGCFITYACVQLCVRTMDFIINCSSAYVICTTY